MAPPSYFLSSEKKVAKETTGSFQFFITHQAVPRSELCSTVVEPKRTEN
jgi:hypothetical protein